MARHLERNGGEKMTDKTHYRKAFNSPYLSSADIVEPTNLTVSHVKLEIDKTKKTKDMMNTAYFVEKEIRHGEILKPMILNATNSKAVAKITGSSFLEDWLNVGVTVYVDKSVRFGKDTVEGLRITARQRVTLTPDNKAKWDSAVAAYKRDGNLDSVLKRVNISNEHIELLKAQANPEQPVTDEAVSDQGSVDAAIAEALARVKSDEGVM